MNAREMQLPLRSDPVPLPRSPSNVQLPATQTDPKPDLMFARRTFDSPGTEYYKQYTTPLSSPLGQGSGIDCSPRRAWLGACFQ